MKNIIILTMMLLFLASIVTAADMVKIETEVKIDWDGNESFTIITEGDDRTFSCIDSAPDDKTWDVDFYKNIDAIPGCGKSEEVSSNFTGDMKYLLGNLSGECRNYLKFMTDSYSDMIKTINSSGDLQTRVIDCEASKSTALAQIGHCESTLEVYGDYNEVKRQRDNYNTRLTASESQYTTCDEELEKKKSNWIIYIIGGVIAGAFGYDNYKKRQGGGSGSEPAPTEQQFGPQNRRDPDYVSKR